MLAILDGSIPNTLNPEFLKNCNNVPSFEAMSITKSSSAGENLSTSFFANNSR